MGEHKEQALALLFVIVAALIVFGLGPVALYYGKVWWCYWGLCP